MSKYLLLFVIFTFLVSCVSKENSSNFINVDSQLLTIPYKGVFLFFPDTTIKMQRKIASEMFIPYESANYLKPKSEMEKLLNNHVIDMELFSSIPSILDVIASSIQDLVRGDIQKAIEKNKNILSVLERKRTKTLNEDYGVSPFREASLVLALAYLQSGNNQEAISILETLVIYSNKWPAIYMVLSDYYYNIGAYSLALDVATKGIDLCTEKFAYLYVLQAKAFRGIANNINALRTLNMADILFPNNSDIILWKGILAYDDKKFDIACNYFKAAYELNKNNPNTAHNYSYCLIQGRQFDLASNVLLAAIADFPSQAHLYYLNGVLENFRMNYFAAQKSWQTYLSLVSESDSNYKTVMFKLSQMTLNDKPSLEDQYFPYPNRPN
jgi:tetratricopeptide (TPR) repeat protein